MGARNGGRPAVALVAITALLASVVVLSVTAGAKRRVILYGDSLAFEARDAFALSLESGGGVEVVDRTLGGTAICDRLDRMREDLHDLQPSAVALEFVGNNVTPCMRGPAGPLTGDGLAPEVPRRCPHRDRAVRRSRRSRVLDGCTGVRRTGSRRLREGAARIPRPSLTA